MVKNEIKIVLTKSKVIICVLFMLVMIALDVPYKNEFIRHKMDFYISILVIIFGCDVMYQELFRETKDIFRKFGLNINFIILLRRLIIQFLFFFGLTFIFFWESYARVEIKSVGILNCFEKDMYSTCMTVLIFGIIVLFFMMVTQSQYMGMGISLVVWIYLTSPWGDKLGPYWNPLWTSQKADEISDIPWMKGKLIVFLIALILFLLIYYLLKHINKREGVVIKSCQDSCD